MTTSYTAGDTVPIKAREDVLASRLGAVFCGLNPALSTLKDGYNFSAPSNRFWRVLYLAGFTPRLLQAREENELLCYGCGITAAVSRATRRADEVRSTDYVNAAPALEARMRALMPDNFAFLGKAAFEAISGQRGCEWGRQDVPFAGAVVWVLPNPSGLNRSFSVTRLVEHYADMRSTMY